MAASNHSAATNNGPIFVFGCPRSGTTLVQLVLHSHPRIAIAPETRFLVPAYRRRLKFGDLEEKANRRRLAAYLTRGMRFGELELNSGALFREIVDGPRTVGSATGIVFRAYARKFGAVRWGSKYPSYHRDLAAIRRMFPDAHFVHVVRDPRSTVASLRRMPWWKRSTSAAVATWALAVDYAREAKRRWPEQVHEVQYERLLADPEGEIERLCAGLGEEFDRGMLEPHQVSDAIPARKRWQESTRRPFTTEAVERWREELTPREVALCETVLGRRMARYGYERSDAGRPAVKDVLRYAASFGRMKKNRWLTHRRDRKAATIEPNPVTSRLASTQSSAETVPQPSERRSATQIVSSPPR